VINTRVNVQTLREITAENGGRTEVVRTSADLAEASARIAEELNSQYVLGYTSSHGADGQFHSIRVRAAKVDAAQGNQDTPKGRTTQISPYRVRARSGYVATPMTRHR
jgi:hypothetical protein